MGTTLNKLEYLDTTKSQIKTALNQFNAGITDNDTFRSYVDKINNIYDNWEKVTGEGTNITLNNTKKGKLDFEDGIVGYGNTKQEGTPTPDNPQDIEVVTGTIEVVERGKNIFNPVLYNNETRIFVSNISSASVTDGEFTFVASGSDMFFGNVISTGGSYTNDKGIKIYRNGKEKISFKCTSNNFTKNYICAFNSNGVSLGFSSTLSYEGTYTFPENCEYVVFRLGKGDAVSGTIYKTKLIVAYGDTIPTYEPYQTPQTYQLSLGEYEFARIGNYVDTIEYDVDEDKVYKNENIVKQVVTGTFLDNLYTFMLHNINSYGIANFLLQYISNSEEALYDFAGLCNYLSTQTSSIANEQNEGILYQQRAVYIRIKSTTASTTQEFKTYVNSLNTGGNPLKIYRQLLTPIKKEITGTLKDQIKALYYSHSFTGTTIIEIEGDLPMIIKVKALKGVSE